MIHNQLHNTFTIVRFYYLLNYLLLDLALSYTDKLLVFRWVLIVLLL